VAPPLLLLFRNVGAHFATLHARQYRAAVITLIVDQFFDAVDVYLRDIVGM
jgi:hypothetical protein